MTSKMNVQPDTCQMIINLYVPYPTFWSYSANSKGRISNKRDIYQIIYIKRLANKINIMVMSDCEQEILFWIRWIEGPAYRGVLVKPVTRHVRAPSGLRP